MPLLIAPARMLIDPANSVNIEATGAHHKYAVQIDRLPQGVYAAADGNQQAADGVTPGGKSGVNPPQCPVNLIRHIVLALHASPC